MPKPTKKLRSQAGNSCAAHCVVIAIAELTDTMQLDADYAEKTVWPRILFKFGENDGITDEFAFEQYSDPRKVVTFAIEHGVMATLQCDYVLKAAAIDDYLSDDLADGYDEVFNMCASGQPINTRMTTKIEEGVYYNCTFLNFHEPEPKEAALEGLHNILMTKWGDHIWYYNPNEANPDWVDVGAGANDYHWMELKKQNDGKRSYVFTGVCVEMKRKV